MGKREIERKEKFLKNIYDTIKEFNLIENGDKLVLGVSGGPDSICMLDVLDKIRKDEKYNLSFEIVVAHINHMIREEASLDEKYVYDYCNKKNIEFYSKSIDVQKLANNNKIGTEEAGRIARYEFLNEILQKTNSDKIAIAHNKNDNAETIIMHLLRGSGIKGLKGIDPKREKIIRPLINCERIDIETYCKENNLEPRIDKNNFENIYTRNKIRNIVIPYIEREYNPNIIQAINNLSKMVKDEDNYIEKKVKESYNKLLIEENDKEITIDLKDFNKQENVIKSRLLLYIITRLFGDTNQISNIHIIDIIKLCNNNIGNKYTCPNKKIKILIKNQKIYFIKQV